jgi:CRP/FNR family transcriptional regulator
VRTLRDRSDGHGQALQVVARGATMAVVRLVEGTPRPASARSLVDSDIGSVRPPDLGRLVCTHGELAWTTPVAFARRLLWAPGRCDDLALGSATGRVVSVVLQFGRRQGREEPGGRPVAELPPMQRELGELTGVSRETLTRTLRQRREAHAVRWTEDGLLVMNTAAPAGWQNEERGARMATEPRTLDVRVDLRLAREFSRMMARRGADHSARRQIDGACDGEVPFEPRS